MGCDELCSELLDSIKCGECFYDLRDFSNYICALESDSFQIFIMHADDTSFSCDV